MHGNQWVLKIAVLKYYSVSKRGTTAKSNPKQATDPISLHTKFGDNSSNTFPLNEWKPCVTPDIGRRTAEKAKIIYPPPSGVDIINDSIQVLLLNKGLPTGQEEQTSQKAQLLQIKYEMIQTIKHI